VGLKELAPLKNLTDLGFYPVTNRSLAVLREINLLHALREAKGSDGKRPSKPEDVTSLDLSRTGVTNVALQQLAPLKNLSVLDLTNTKVTDEGVEEFQKEFPKCKIKR